MTHVMALDVGGTSTTLGIINSANRLILERISVATQPGLETFPVFLGDLVEKGMHMADERQLAIQPTIRLALPGNFKPGFDIQLAPGSARQLILKNESFKDARIMPWITTCFPNGVDCFVVNDALAQAVGAMQHHWCDEFANTVMLYIGPGTGLGGAILKLGDNPNEFDVLTDGHLFDIMVTVRGKRVMAEDVLSGRGIVERSGITAKSLSETLDHWNQHQPVVHDCATVLIQVLQAIQNQTVTKQLLVNQWSIQDMAMISEVGVVMLGGSIGTKGRIGQHLAVELRNVFNGMVLQSEDPSSNALLGVQAFAKKYQTDPKD